MSSTDNVKLRNTISLVVNSSLFRKILNGIIVTEYEKMASNINQRVDEVISRLNDFDLTIPNDYITTDQLQDISITSDKLADNSVTINKLANSSVTIDKLGNSSVTTVKLADNTVTTVKLVNSSVTTDKLADNSVTTNKLADNSVTTNKIDNNAIISRHLAEGSVTLPALSSDITNLINNSQSDELGDLHNRVTNIENYLTILSSTYKIVDENNGEIKFIPI
jgi:hypothetical protein